MTDDHLPAAARDVLDFWIGNADNDAAEAERRESFWFGSSTVTDAEIESRFAGILRDVRAGKCRHWLDSAEGTLAQVIVLDQFPRNLFRGTAEAFACDARALELGLELVDSGGIEKLGWMSRAFALMPLQHAEDADVQERSVRLFEALAEACDSPHRKYLENNAGYARLHRDIVARFGRFPHRNRALGRESTADELAWLAADAPTFGQG